MKKIIIISIILALIVTGGFYYFINVENEKNIKQNKIVFLDGRNMEIEDLSDEEFNLFLNSGVINVKYLRKFGVYVDLDYVNDIITISDVDDILRYYLDSEKTFLNGIESNIGIIEKDGEYYINYSKILDIYDVSVDIGIKSNNVLVKNLKEPYYYFKNVNKIKIKLLNGKEIKSLDENLILGNESDSSVVVINSEKYIGNINRSKVLEINKIDSKLKSTIIVNKDNRVINLTWEYVNKYNPKVENLYNMKGVNIISPTWFSLKDSSGNVNSNVSKGYVNWANDNGYELWPLVSNRFDPKLTRNFIKNGRAREKFIKTLLDIYIKNGFEGINIDFENMYKEDALYFSMFVNELSVEFRRKNLIVSVDITVPDGSDFWSKCYDRITLSKSADYLIVMTYDEHYASSPVSGSVASHAWVKNNIEKLLEIMPSEKLIMGIPLYTRIWYETPSQTVANKMDVKSKAITIKAAKKIIEENDYNLIWDEYSKQYYIVYFEENRLVKIWLEEEKSILEKVKLANEYNLAGIASWRKGYEPLELWEYIDDILKQ